jgi:hypothetical protein
MFRALSGHGRLARAFVLAAVLLAFNSLNTSASIGWCRSDPVLRIEGNLADVFVSIPLAEVPKVNGPTRFVITTPGGIDEAVLLTSPGFGYGETVTFQESSSLKLTSTGIQLRIKAFVPATNGTIPVLVEFAPRVIGILKPASAEGFTNQWITIQTSL